MWLAENLKSIHYSDGTEIPEVVSYNNDENLAEIYGRLYTWDAAMNGSANVSAQGVCPCGWHVPSDEEWKELENYLGGSNIAGGKMKESGISHWNAPNTGSDNSSGLTFLPGGEYDAHYIPNKFSLINEYAVLWTSSEINTLKARERYLSFSDAKSSIYDWYKTMKYSVRCVKDTFTTALGNNDKSQLNSFNLQQNYPNPFNPNTTIEYYLPFSEEINISVYNLLGMKVKELYAGKQNAGKHRLNFSAEKLPSGLYLYKIHSNNYNNVKACLLLK
jgi:uncharacterized protein (TIGR02145 family)